MERPELSTGLFVGIVRERLEFVYEESKPHSFSPPGERGSNLGADIQSADIEAWYKAFKSKVPKSDLIQIRRNQTLDPWGDTHDRSTSFAIKIDHVAFVDGRL